MKKELTFSMIKPDAMIRPGIADQIQSIIEKNGLKIVAQKSITLTDSIAREFYSEHKDKSFFNDMIKNICAGPVIVQVLEGVNAIAKARQIMGATNPANAEEGTIRKQFGQNLDFNSIHGSDSADSARKEIDMFFNSEELKVN